MSVLLPTAADRLVLSRERLHQALREISAPAAGSKNAGPEAWVWAWFSNLKAKPGASGLVEAMRKLWTQHPLRVAGELAIDVAKTVLKPFAQRHPISLVLGAFALGGLMAWTRPWRPLLTPALLVGLLPQISHDLISRILRCSRLRRWRQLWLEFSYFPIQKPCASLFEETPSEFH